MNNFKSLSKKEKIELIKRIQSGSVSIVAGQIIDGGVVLIKKNGQFFLNGVLVNKEEIEKHATALIILPAKNEETEE